MKRFHFLQVAVLVTLMVIVVGCSIPRSAAGGYYEQETPVRRNVHLYDNSYYGNMPIILERDPFTGRYYQVMPYNSYSTPYGYYGVAPYDYYYDNRNNRYYRGGNIQQQPGQQTEAQRQERQRQTENAKDAILGKKRD